MTDALFRSVKFNCDLSDARYWGYFSICGLLMRYRDLFRSEQGLEPWDPVESGKITAWIQAKEARWPELEDLPFRSLMVPGSGACDPFDADTVNKHLVPGGLVYGAGYGTYLKPTFFVARVLAEEEVEGHRVLTTGAELVRDLFTAPAMLQGRTIYLRTDPVRALLWDHYTQLVPGRCAALEEAFLARGVQAGQPMSDGLAAGFGKLTADLTSLLLRHELAESRGSLPLWKEVLVAAGDRRYELFLRALQDLLADTSDEGPLRMVLDARDTGALALYLGLLDGFRRLLAADLRAAFERFRRTRDWNDVEEARRREHERCGALRQSVLDLFRAGDTAAFRAGLGGLMKQSEQRPVTSEGV